MVYSFSLQCVATVYNIDRGSLYLSVSTAVFVSNVWFLLWRREWLPQHACMQALSAVFISCRHYNNDRTPITCYEHNLLKNYYTIAGLKNTTELQYLSSCTSKVQPERILQTGSVEA